MEVSNHRAVAGGPRSLIFGLLAWLMIVSPAGAYLGDSGDHLKELYGEPFVSPDGWASYTVERDLNPGVLDHLKVRLQQGKVVDAILTHIEPKPNKAIRIEDLPRRMREHLVNVGLGLKAVGGKLVGRFQRYRELIHVYEIPISGNFKSIRADYTLAETEQSITYRYRVRFLTDTPRYLLAHLPDGLSPLGRVQDPLEPFLQGR